MPQPRIEFDLGGTYHVTSVSVQYITGGLAGIMAPDVVEIRFSTDNGTTFSESTDVIFSNFDQTRNNTQIPTISEIELVDQNVTHVRLDFFQGNSPGDSFSEWVFLGEVTFEGVQAPTIPTLTEWGIIMLILILAVAAIFQVKRQRLSGQGV